MAAKIKVIKTEEDYNEALKLLEELMAKDPEPDSEDGERLSLLATLIEDYESKTIPESLPDPIDAILFRMEQQNLKSTDLIPYIGSRSKVSEVLSRKRPLTLSMIRSLEAGLGIPAKVLVKEPDEFRNVDDIAWNRFPIKEMEKRGYFESRITKTTDIKALVEKFLLPIGSPAQVFGMLRKTNYSSTRPMDKHALIVWTARVVEKANSIRFPKAYAPGTVNLEFMQQIVKLSAKDKGPILAQDLLKENGIALVVEPHFSQTYLDGATIMVNKEHPVVGLTIKQNRLDNFWFNLMHELAHIALHSSNNFNLFYDDLDNPDPNNTYEQEADQLASEALIPENKWEISPARIMPSYMAAKSLAEELGIHISIVAGKMRHEGRNYTYLNNVIKQSTVREYFPEIKWSN